VEPTVGLPGLSSWNTTFSMAARLSGVASGSNMHAPPEAFTPATAHSARSARTGHALSKDGRMAMASVRLHRRMRTHLG
jgi:hypothetical protein